MEGASITYMNNEQIKVRIDHERCIACGACIHACHHNVRDYEDDTERFLRDLQSGASISMFVAPAIRASGLEYGRVFSWLRDMGVNKIYDVSLGADICIWAHIKYIKANNPKSIITQPCPAIVNYILLYENDLMKYLSPVHSPMLCTAIYMKEYCNITDDIAALSPCVAKSHEFEDTGYVNYNVTIKKLYEYISRNDIQLPAVSSHFDHNESALGRLFSMPGGLKENIEFYFGKELRIDQAEGQETVYDALSLFSRQQESDLPVIFDVLNCPGGCNIGTGCFHDINRFKAGEAMDRNRKLVLENVDSTSVDDYFNEYESLLRLDDFMRDYAPKTVERIDVTPDQIENAYAAINKLTEDKRVFDCGACGSESCYGMARRIALGYDVPSNCIQNEKDIIQSDNEKIININLELEKKREEAEAASRTKSAFLANISHEIRTPMNSIIGFSELAHDDDVSPKTKQYLGNITENAKWLLNIINDILDSAKIESGKITLEYIPFDLQNVITQCQSAILPKTVEKGITLYCYAEPFRGKKLVGDPVRLRQVFMNLLSNAVKFTNNGTIKLLASFTEHSDSTATINFEMKDSGIGMHPEQIANIFEPFMQADESVTRKFGGTGLGLPIAKNIIEMMGGSMIVDSTPGVGSNFSFSLTFDITDDTIDMSSKKTIFNDIEKPTFNGEILVCEDNHLNQQVACEHLARVGIRSLVADNGKEGIDIIVKRIQNNEKPFDLVFMDIHMPVMDGLEAASKLREMGVKTPIIALTANIMSNDIELYRTSGMLDYLGKPFTSQELWKCLIKYLPVMETVIVDKAQQSAEDDKTLKQLRGYFIKSNKGTFANIKQAMDTGDIKQAHRLMHTLKSNAGQIGEKQLQKAAAETEDLLSKGSELITEAQMVLLETELNSVLERLTPLVEADKKRKTEYINSEKSMDILAELEPMLIKRNPQCMNLLDEIRNIPGADDLLCFVEDLDFNLAIEELHKLKGKLHD